MLLPLGRLEGGQRTSITSLILRWYSNTRCRRSTLWCVVTLYWVTMLAKPWVLLLMMDASKVAVMRKVNEFKCQDQPVICVTIIGWFCNFCVTSSTFINNSNFNDRFRPELVVHPSKSELVETVFAANKSALILVYKTLLLLFVSNYLLLQTIFTLTLSI